jgi:hypothetical protein
MAMLGLSNRHLKCTPNVDLCLTYRDLLQTLQSKLNKRSSTRNFALGCIYLSANYSGDSKISIPSAREQCTRYFTEYGRKAACFADTQSYVACLSKEDQCQFLHDIAATIKVDEVLPCVNYISSRNHMTE